MEPVSWDWPASCAALGRWRRQRPRTSKRRTAMTDSSHLWAIGYDEMARAGQVRDAIVKLGWDERSLILQDVAVVVRHPDGSFALERERFPSAANVVGGTVVGLLAGLVIGVPLVGAAVGAVIAGAGSAGIVTIDENFVADVQIVMKPGTAALFVLDDAGEMDVIIHRLRGLGGTVLKTNVDVDRAQLIQSVLSATSNPSSRPTAGE